MYMYVCGDVSHHIPFSPLCMPWSEVSTTVRLPHIPLLSMASSSKPSSSSTNDTAAA